MCLEVTYGVSRIAHVVCFYCVRCSLFQAVNHSVVPLFFFGGLGQRDGAWWVVAAHRVAMDACVPCSGLVAQGSLLALESPPTLAGTISKLIYWR